VHRSHARRAPPGLSALAGAVALAAAVGMAALWPSADPGPEAAELSSFEAVYRSEVIGRSEIPCAGAEEARCIDLSFRLLEGPDEGSTTTLELPASSPRLGGLRVGRSAFLGHQPDVRGFEYVLLEPDRGSPLLLLTAIFLIATVALGRWKGVSALVGLASTLLVLFLFVVPAILDGRDPLLVSLVGSVVIAYAALYLTHGFGPRTTIAVLGTLGGLACAAVLAVLFMDVATITGLASEEALFLSAVGAELDLRGLILGGMMIGALGAIDDMTVTQASAVWELRTADAAMSSRRLLRAGMRIGRSHVASTVNTLVLAYAGASLPLLLLFVLSDQPVSTVASGEIVATEIVRTLVGSIGLVASVPITTWLAVRVASGTDHHSAPAPGRATDVGALDRGEGPEEHPIPEHRRDVLVARLRRRRADPRGDG
jgi:uncharacterized membrane protein